jgi:3-hydroxyacyl-CoA dehydrogenase
MSDLPRKIAVIGAGDIGRGWAALCASAGWPVTIFDTDGEVLEQAVAEVGRRARALVAFERAPHGVVERGLLEFHPGRSLLHAVRDADWVIEAVPEDLQVKQTAFERIEEVAGPEALLSSSTSGLPPTDIFARCLAPARWWSSCPAISPAPRP